MLRTMIRVTAADTALVCQSNCCAEGYVCRLIPKVTQECIQDRTTQMNDLKKAGRSWVKRIREALREPLGLPTCAAIAVSTVHRRQNALENSILSSPGAK